MSSPVVVRDPNQWLTTDQAAGEMNCGVQYVRQLCRNGDLKHRNKGRFYLIKRSHIKEYEDAQVNGGSDDA